MPSDRTRCVHDQRTRILLETTGTLETSVNTGIPRVVRSLVREARRMDAPGAPRVVPVIFRNGRFYDATEAWTRILPRHEGGGHTLVERLQVAMGGVSPRAARLYDSVRTRLHKIFYPKTLVRAAGSAYWHATGRRIVFNENDVLLLLDTPWHHPIWPAVRDVRQRGCRVGAVMYDLIPLEHPEFFKPPFSAVFSDWLENLIDHSEFFLAISETVRASLETHVRSSRTPEVAAGMRFESFRLGADIPQSARLAAVRPALRRLFGDHRGQAPYLVVGTIEPRKNHRYVLDALELLWQRFPAARLCIVGRIGWECRDVLDRIARHPRTGRTLFAFHDLSDNELTFCYQGAKALVTASVAEGFGLPIVEALGHGLPVFASDIPVHREVGGSRCRFFDLRSAQCLAMLLGDVEPRGRPLSLPDDGTGGVITWSESCRALLTKIRQLPSRVSEADVPHLATHAPPPAARQEAA